MLQKKLATLFVLIGVSLLSFALPVSSVSASGKREDLRRLPRPIEEGLQEKILRSARESAAEHNLDVKNCEARVAREGDLWVVEFSPPSGTIQFGGGGRFWFEIQGDNVMLKKVGIWE